MPNVTRIAPLSLLAGSSPFYAETFMPNALKKMLRLRGNWTSAERFQYCFHPSRSTTEKTFTLQQIFVKSW